MLHNCSLHGRGPGEEAGNALLKQRQTNNGTRGRKRQKEKQTGGERDRKRNRQEEKQTGGETDRRRNRQKEKQTGGETQMIEAETRTDKKMSVWTRVGSAEGSKHTQHTQHTRTHTTHNTPAYTTHTQYTKRKAPGRGRGHDCTHLSCAII